MRTALFAFRSVIDGPHPIKNELITGHALLFSLFGLGLAFANFDILFTFCCVIKAVLAHMDGSVYVKFCFRSAEMTLLFCIGEISLLPLDVFVLFDLESDSLDTQFTAILSVSK